MASNLGNAQESGRPVDSDGVHVDTGCRLEPVAGGGRVNGHSHNFAALIRSGGFRKLLGIRLSSQVADGLFQAGLAGSVLFNPEQGASAMAIAAAFAVILLPYSIIGPYVGVLIDRWSRRTVMMVTSLLRGVLVIPTAVLIWHGSEGLFFLATTLFIIGLGRLFLAACSAATPHVVEDDRLVTANAMVNTLGSLAYSLGLGIVAALMLIGLPATFHGYAIAAALAPLGYLTASLASRWAFSRMGLGPDTPQHAHIPLRHAIAETRQETLNGFRHIARRRVASSLLATQSAHRVLYGVLALVVTLRYRSDFTQDGDLVSTLSGLGGACVAAGAGAVLAATLTPALSRRWGGARTVVGLLGVTGGVVAAFALLPSALLLPVAVGWVALASQSTKIVVDTALQHECDDEYRGRAFSINDTLFNICFVTGTYLGAITLPSDGDAPLVLSAVAVAYVIVAGALATSVGLTRQSRATGLVIPAARRGARSGVPVSLSPVVVREDRQRVHLAVVPSWFDTDLDGKIRGHRLTFDHQRRRTFADEIRERDRAV